MAAPMVRAFFEGIKGDIKEIIAPPKKALIVDNESKDKPDSGDTTKLPTGDVPLKAIPVEPLDSGTPPEPLDKIDKSPPEPRPSRALPVGGDEVMEENVEQP